MANNISDSERLAAARSVKKELLDLGLKETEALQAYSNVLNKTLDTYEDINSLVEALVENRTKLLNIEGDLKDILKNASKDYATIAKLTDQEIDQQQVLLQLKLEELELLEQQADIDTDRIDKTKELITKTLKQLAVAKQVRSVYGDFAPYIGNVIDAVDSLTDGLKGMFPSWMDGAVDKLGKTLKDAAISGKGLGVGMAAVGAALVGAFVVLDKFRQSAEETATATGLTVDQSAELVKQSYVLQASSENRLSTQEEILDANVALVKEFGNLNLISADTVQNVAGIADAFGVSVDTVAQVQRSFEQIGNVSPQVASDISTATMSLAEAAGVQPAKVMEDIAKNAGVASKYFAGNPKALAKAAVEMAKIGLSLEKASTVAEGLLDIEKSLTAQFEASAMIGRQLNFDAARRLAIEGDIAGATKEVLNQVGSIAEFEQMNALQRNAIATATGLTVDELQRSMVLQEKTMNMTAEEAALVSKYGSDLGNINNLTSEEVANRAKSVQATEQLTTSLDKIKSTIMPAIVSLAQALTPVFQLLSFLVESIVAPFKILSALFSWDGDIIKGMSTWQQIIGSILIAYGTIYTINKGIAAYTALTAANGARSLTFAQRRLIVERRNAIYAAIQGGWKAITMGGGWAGLALLAAATAVIGGIVAAVSRQDDMIMSPISGPAGYSRVLSGPEGAYALNDRDTIVAGTNLGGRGGSAPEIDYNRMADAFANAVRSTQIVIGRGAVGAIGEQVKVNNSFA